MQSKTSKTTDLTQGSPLLQLVLFALPLTGSTLFQQLYNFADTVMVGRFVGVNALAGVGATYSLHFLTLGFVQGACVGFSIPLSQSFGAKNETDLRRYFWNGCWLSIALAAVLTVVMTLSAGALLHLIQTPSDIYTESYDYIRVLFLGIPASTAYNFLSNVLRSVGDSKHPFYFLVFSCVLNIGLDYVMLTTLHMGVTGAALATVLSQLLCGLLTLWWLMCRMDLFPFRREEARLSQRHVRQLCLIGLPMGFEYSVSAIGAIILQGGINALGSVAVAGQTTGEKIRQFFTLPMESVGMAMATYVGQNYGAKDKDRIQSGIRSGLLIQLVCCAAAWVILFVFGQFLVNLVIGDAASESTQYALEYLVRLSPFLLLHGALMIFRNTLQGMGYTLHAVVSGVGELVGRSIGSLASICFGFAAICYANPLAWGLALCYCIGMVLHYLAKDPTLSK